MADSSRPRERDRPRAGERWTGSRPIVSGPPVVIGIAVIAIAIGVIAATLGRSPGLPAALSQAYSALMAGTLTPEIRVTDPSALAARLRDAGAGFAPRIVPLEPELSLIGGQLRDLQGRPAAAWIYEAPDRERMLGIAFRGTVADLGEPDDMRPDPPPALQIYRKMTQTIVCWQEGDLVYSVITTLPSERVIALARRAATRPAGAQP
jgi:hypothetical protein